MYPQNLHPDAPGREAAQFPFEFPGTVKELTASAKQVAAEVQPSNLNPEYRKGMGTVAASDFEDSRFAAELSSAPKNRFESIQEAATKSLNVMAFRADALKSDSNLSTAFINSPQAPTLKKPDFDLGA